MRLATIRTEGGHRAVRVDGDHYVELAAGDLGELLAGPDWQVAAAAPGVAVSLTGTDFAPPVPRPGKILCVGLNYRGHIQEMGRELRWCAIPCAAASCRTRRGVRFARLSTRRP